MESKDEIDPYLLLELMDPVTWLEKYTAWRPFSWQAEFLRDFPLRLRVVRKSRQIGMTTTISREAIFKAYTMPARLILLTSPSERQSNRVMCLIHGAIDVNEALYKRIVRMNTTEIELDNKSMIVSLPNSPETIRGYPATDIYLDEAAHFLNDEGVMAVLQPMLIATKGSLTINSTPSGKRGIFWERYQFAVNQKGLDPQVRHYDFFPSIINPFITEADLEKEKFRLSELEYLQEYGAQFLEEVDVYYPMDLITPCIVPSLELLERGEPGKGYIYGIDFAKQRDETVVMILERFYKECPICGPIGGYHFILRHIEAWSHMDYSDQIGRIGELTKKFRPSLCGADQTGVGEAIIEDLKGVVPSTEGYVFSIPVKVDMAAGLRAVMEQKRLHLVNDRKMIMQINGLRYQVTKAGNLIFESPEKERLHDDYLWALALAVYRAREPPAVIQPLFG